VKDGKAWVGDVVFDEDAERTGLVHDVRQGVFVLRPLTGGAYERWQCHDVDRLTIVTSREERMKT
jgi:hypothetical protein